MEFTKEQEEEFERMRYQNEHETIYMCVECATALIGMMNVRIHYEEHKHYEYKRPGIKGRLMFL